MASERLALQGELQTGLRECDEASSQNQYSADCTTFIGMLHNRSHCCAPQVIAAELAADLSFTSFRHGGLTELGDSELTDSEIRAIS